MNALYKGIIIDKFVDDSYYKRDFNISYKGKGLDDDKTFSEYNIPDNSTLYIFYRCYGGGIYDKIKDELADKIGFNQKLIKRDELYINLIYFDLQMTNKENYNYYINFKIDVVGGFHAIDDLDILKKYLEVINQKNINFIFVTSGSSAKDVISICKQYSFIKEIIIFCKNRKKYEKYIEKNPNYLKKIFT